MAHKKYKDRSRKNANDRKTNSQKTENKNKFFKNIKKQMKNKNTKQLKYCNDKYMKSKSNISRKYSYITLKKGSPIVMLFPLL